MKLVKLVAFVKFVQESERRKSRSRERKFYEADRQR